VLEHVHRHHRIEALVGVERLGVGDAVVDLEPLLRGVLSRHFN
jgi:hypothetical protein